MKKRYVSLALLLLLTACGTPAEKTQSAQSLTPAATAVTAEPAATPVPTEEPTLPLHWIDVQNSEGRFQREPVYGAGGYGDGGVVARYVDFYDATEQIIGEPLELENANLYLLADDEFLYWSWSGMIRDTPILLRSNLDGSNRESLYDFPQGTAISVWDGGMASDGTALYFQYCHISDNPAVPDEYELVRLDPEAKTMETLTKWNTFGGTLVGVWNDRLLITRTTLADDCPVEPVYSTYHLANREELSAWLTTTLCALNPATGQEEVLYTSTIDGMLDRTLAEDALWSVNDQNRLIRRPLGETVDQVLVQLPQGAYIWGVYTEDVLLYSQEDGEEWLYVYNLAGGSLNRSPRKQWFGGEYRAISVIGEAGPGRYLVIDDANTGMQQLAGSDGTQYLIDGYTRYAIAGRDALLDTNVPLVPVTRPGVA